MSGERSRARASLAVSSILAVTLLAQSVPSTALAQSTTSVQSADDAKRKGDEAMVALRYAEALEQFAAKASPELKARVPKLDQLVSDVRSRVCTLVISSTVADADIRLGEKVIGQTTSGQLTLRVSAGKQHLPRTSASVSEFGLDHVADRNRGPWGLLRSSTSGKRGPCEGRSLPSAWFVRWLAR